MRKICGPSASRWGRISGFVKPAGIPGSCERMVHQDMVEKSEKSKGKKNGFLLYKGRPLVRSGNTLYYGNMTDKCVIMLQILSTKTVGDMTMADKVQVQLLSTDPDLRMKERILKKSEKTGLYNAMDIGVIWLERALESD